MPAFSENDPLNIRLELESVPAGPRICGRATARDPAHPRASWPGFPPALGTRVAEQLGVGRSAVREALAALEILGIVQIRPGSGTFLQGGTSDLLPTTLSWGLMLASNRTRELLEVRSSLERTAAILAAQRATPRSSTSSRGSTSSGSASPSTTPQAFIESRRPVSTCCSHVPQGTTSWRTSCRASARCSASGSVDACPHPAAPKRPIEEPGDPRRRPARATSPPHSVRWTTTWRRQCRASRTPDRSASADASMRPRRRRAECVRRSDLRVPPAPRGWRDPAGRGSASLLHALGRSCSVTADRIVVPDDQGKPGSLS